ncbi:unnamed protein product [Sphagnum balticum]
MIDNMVPYTAKYRCFLSGGFWLTLLEKAWAKHLGSYSRLDTVEDVPLTEIISDLTAAPSEELRCDHPKILQQLKTMLAKNYILVACNQHNLEKQMKVEYRLGIPSDYSYPIEQVDGEYFILRNVVENGYHNSITVRQKKGFYSLVEVACKEGCSGFITLSQIDKLTSMEEYSYCRMVLFENKGERAIYLQEVESYGKKTHIEVELTNELSYLVLVEMHWIAKEY